MNRRKRRRQVSNPRRRLLQWRIADRSRPIPMLFPHLPLDLPSSPHDNSRPPPPPTSVAAAEARRDPEAASEEDAIVPPTPAAAAPPDVFVPDLREEPPAPPLRSPKLHHNASFSRKKKVALLTASFRPVPFSPDDALATLDLAAHETLFRALGLWDFAHLPLDRGIRSDLLVPLIANYEPAKCRSFVGGLRVSISRPDLARALMLPIEKDKAGCSEPCAEDDIHDLFSREDSISAIVDFMSVFMLFQFQDDACIVPTEVVTVHRLVKEGLPHKVDWAGLLWMLVEKELLEASNSGVCHYASHLQCLIKYQQPRLFLECECKIEPAPEIECEVENSTDVEMEENHDAEDGTEIAAARARSSDDFGVSIEEKWVPGLSSELGGDSAIADSFEQFKEGKEQHMEVENNGGTEHFLKLCNSHGPRNMEFENLCIGDGDGRKEEGYGEDFSGKYDFLDRMGSFDRDRLTSTDFIQVVDQDGVFSTMRSDGQKTMPLDHENGKRKISEIVDEEEDEEETQAMEQSNQQKRLRSSTMWESLPSGLDSIMEQTQLFAGKAILLSAEKKEACIDTQLQLQYLNEILQQKDRIIQSLEKTRVEEQQKWRMEARRNKQEIYLLGNLMIGYRRALNESRRAFTEYRKKYPQGEEPLYKDVAGSGGLVLSTNELERQRLEKGNELRRATMNIVHSFEKEWMLKLERSASSLLTLFRRIMELEVEIKLLKERFEKPVTSDA